MSAQSNTNTKEHTMAHEITATDNLFSVREMPWHGLGTVLSEYPTRDEAKAIAHNWEPVTAPTYRAVPGFTAGVLAECGHFLPSSTEERRVGKECVIRVALGGRCVIKKKT